MAEQTGATPREIERRLRGIGWNVEDATEVAGLSVQSLELAADSAIEGAEDYIAAALDEDDNSRSEGTSLLLHGAADDLLRAAMLLYVAARKEGRAGTGFMARR